MKKYSYPILAILSIVIIASTYTINPSSQISNNLTNGVFAQSENINNPLLPTRSQGSEHSKIHSDIIKIMEDSNPKKAAGLFRADYQNEKLEVYIYLKAQTQNKPSIEILDEYENIVYSRLPFNQIQALANSNLVEKITLPKLAETRVVSEGVAFSMADEMHATGITGNGIVVAVIDDSFFIDNPEINGTGSVLSAEWGAGCNFQNLTCWSTGVNSTNSHGTAVAEIVLDMAPDAKLRLFAIRTDIDFKKAVDNIIVNYTDVDIITASLGFPELGGDGTNPERWYRDGTSAVARKVNEASNSTNQIFFTVAAGNQGKSHWMGNYTAINVTSTFPPQLDSIICPGCYDTVMNFNSTASGNMKACLPFTDTKIDDIRVAWNDWGLPPASPPSQDYDIFLYNHNMTSALGPFSQNDQVSGQDPFEELTKNTSNNVCLVVASWINQDNPNTKDHLFHIEAGVIDIDPSFKKQGSIDSPADAVGALSVGAILHTNGELEDFSSQGPTDDGRAKPEICGPDGTTSSMPAGPLNPFFGTSAATPHVSGALALLLEENSTKNLNLNFTQIQQKLISNALNGTYSVDNLCGSDSGALNLVETGDCSPPPTGDWTVTSSCEMTGNETINDGDLIVQDNSVLTIPSGVELDIDFANHHLTVKFGSGVLVKSGGKIT